MNRFCSARSHVPVDRSKWAIIFDLDGTLVDTAPDLTAALNYTLRQLGAPEVEELKVRHLVGHGAAALIRSAVPADEADALVALGRPIFLDYYRANICGGSRLYPGARAVLKELNERFSLAVCTNKPEALARRLLSQLEVDQFFEVLIGGDTCSSAKPSPVPLLTAMERAGARCGLLVGDSIVDAEAARAADMPFVAVTFGYCDRPVEELHAEWVINDYQQLRAAIEALTD